jgi:hypothetical protein
MVSFRLALLTSAFGLASFATAAPIAQSPTSLQSSSVDTTSNVAQQMDSTSSSVTQSQASWSDATAQLADALAHLVGRQSVDNTGSAGPVEDFDASTITQAAGVSNVAQGDSSAGTEQNTGSNAAPASGLAEAMADLIASMSG